MDKLQAFANEQLKTEIPQFEIGDSVVVHNKIKEGSRERIQLFDGLVIAKKNGGIAETFTVRKIAYGIGVEKTFPLHSPNVVKVDVTRRGKVRRAKLYYVRERVGKATKVKELIASENSKPVAPKAVAKATEEVVAKTANIAKNRI